MKKRTTSAETRKRKRIRTIQVSISGSGHSTRGLPNEGKNRTLEEVPERDSIERANQPAREALSHRRETALGRPEEQKYAVRHSIMNAKAGIRKALRGSESDAARLSGAPTAASGSPEKKASTAAERVAEAIRAGIQQEKRMQQFPENSYAERVKKMKHVGMTGGTKSARSTETKLQKERSRGQAAEKLLKTISKN